MPIIDPAIALSSRQEAFHNHYHDKTQVNMSFHDMPQQPARPAGVVPDGAKQPAPARHADRPRFSRQAKCVLCLPRARAIRRANRAGADTRPRPRRLRANKGRSAPGSRRRYERNGVERTGMEAMTCHRKTPPLAEEGDSRKDAPHARTDRRICAPRMQTMTSHDTSRGVSSAPHDET